jgi:hypothetical protein
VPKYITPPGDHERTFAAILLGLLTNPRVHLSGGARGAMHHLAALSTGEMQKLSTAEFHGVLPHGAMTWSQTNMTWRTAQFRRHEAADRGMSAHRPATEERENVCSFCALIGFDPTATSLLDDT